jgi:hypothetical protein
MSGSTVGAAADLLSMLLSAWLLAIPFLFAVGVTAMKNQNPFWPFAAVFAGVVAFVLARSALMPHVRDLDVPLFVLLPILIGSCVSVGVIVVIWKLPVRVGRRSWKVLRLDLQGELATLAADRGRITISGSDPRCEIARDQLLAIEQDYAVVHLRWRTLSGPVQSASLLPQPRRESDDPRVLAEAIISRVRRRMLRHAERPPAGGVVDEDARTSNGSNVERSRGVA